MGYLVKLKGGKGDEDGCACDRQGVVFVHVPESPEDYDDVTITFVQPPHPVAIVHPSTPSPPSVVPLAVPWVGAVVGGCVNVCLLIPPALKQRGGVPASIAGRAHLRFVRTQLVRISDRQGEG